MKSDLEGAVRGPAPEASRRLATRIPPPAAAQVRKVANHLGFVGISDEHVADVVHFTSFQQMKVDKDRYNPKSVEWAKGYEFLRAGRNGDGVAALDDTAKALLDADKKARLAGLTKEQSAVLFGH